MTGAGEEPDSLSPATLLEVLGDARSAGYLGPGPLGVQIRHGEGFATVAKGLWNAGAGARSAPATPRIVDLGSGGGVPGLVVAQSWPEAELVLLEASGRRAAFLRRAVGRMGLDARVTVLEGRAEEIGREAAVRGTFDGALARSFGKPAVVSECAAPFLHQESWLVVSEPPVGSGADVPRVETSGPSPAPRWPAEELLVLGLRPLGPVRAEFEYQALRQVSPCPARFPRRNGVPAKKPLF